MTKFNGTSGDDQHDGGSGSDILNGFGGNDTLSGYGGNDIIRGGIGDDVLFGGSGNDILNGQTGNDRLHGGNGNDTMDGGAQDDMLAGGPGDDILTGGTGADIFKYVSVTDSGSDKILDFSRAQGDKIKFDGMTGVDDITDLTITYEYENYAPVYDWEYNSTTGKYDEYQVGVVGVGDMGTKITWDGAGSDDYIFMPNYSTTWSASDFDFM